MSQFLCRLLAVLTLFTLTTAAQAGTWSRLQSESHGDCSLLFDGAIEKGDLTRAVDDGLLQDFAPRICLNSPGGSLSEVLAFLERSEADQGGFFFSTRVRKGDECLSSCAILFMFGQAFGANSPYPSRQLAPGARLGFHSPFIADGTARATSDAEVFRVALQVAKLLADRSYKAVTAVGPPLPPELLALVLGTPSAKMRFVDTIGEARVMNIDLLDDPEPKTVFADRRDVLDRLMKQICISSHTLTFRSHMVDEGYDYADLIARAADPEFYDGGTEIHLQERIPAEQYSSEKLRAVLTGPGFYQPGWYSAGSMMYCRVELSLERAPGGVTVPSYFVDFDFIGGEEFHQIPPTTSTINAMSAGLLPLDTRY